MRIIFAGLVSILLGSPAAGAAELTEMPIDLPTSLSDDVEAGHFREWQANLPCGADTLKATLRIDDLHPDKHWAASLRIGLYEEQKRDVGKRDPGKKYVSLILGLVDEGDPLKFELDKKEGASTLQSMTFSVPEALGRVFPVQASWTSKGAIDFAIGGKPLEPISLDHAPASVTFVISGAQGEFADIKAGRSGPSDSACAESTPIP